MVVSSQGAAVGTAWAVEVVGLTKAFGRFRALRGIDLRVKRGEFLTVFGPNGAGKSTLIKVLATLFKPDGGQATLLGLRLPQEAQELRRRIGVVTHQTLLYDELTVEENLRFYGKMYDVAHLSERVLEVADIVGLASRLHDRVRTLSRGLQQRLSIGRAVLHDPELMLLDEPETGLDRQGAAMLGSVVRGTPGRPRTVIMTTHSLERGLDMGDRAVILVQGRAVYQEERRFLDPKAFATTYARYTGAEVP